MRLWTSSAVIAATAMAITAAILCLVTLVEFAAPRGRYPLASRARGAAFWALYVPLSALVLTGLTTMWRRVGIAPLATLDLAAWFSWAGPIRPLLTGLALVVAMDFVSYWFHRLQHGMLWRFHAVHHAIREMHAVGSYDHPADILLGFVLVAVPLSLVSFGATGEGVILQLLLAAHLKFTHASTRLHFGPFRRVFVDNAYHRIHHSVEARHIGKNFGSITTVWDQVFGTAYFPSPEEWPPTGLPEVAEPRSMREFLAFPFRLRTPRQVGGRSASGLRGFVPGVAGDAVSAA